MSAPRYGRRLSAAVAAVALGATALMGVAVSAAQAAPSNIDPNLPRSLTIHKLSQPATPGVAGDGSELAPGSLPVDALPINGVEFTVEQVTQIGGTPIDLTTDAGWATIQPYLNGTTPFDPLTATLGAPVAETTANGGLAVFDTLPVGLFYVTETDFGGNSIDTPAQPFLVTLPMPTTEPGVFRYDVHAYPKNTLGDEPYAVKTVDDASAYAMGEKFTWAISTQIPNTPGYTVVDFTWADNDGEFFQGTYDLPPGLMLPQSITVITPGGVETELDYNDYFSPSTGGTVWNLTTSGLAKVNTAGPGSVIRIVYASVVKKIPGNGVIENVATVCVNTGNPGVCAMGDPNMLNVRAETLWGKALLTKHAAGDATKVLAGAGFQVFATEAAANAAAAQLAAGQTVTGALEFCEDPWITNSDMAPRCSEPVQSTFTTDDTGVVTIPGLKASQAGITYWAVETKAPAGYVASTTPIEFTVTPGDTPTGAAAVNVPNQMRQAGALPVLGGAGMAAIGIGGAILIAGGVLFAIFGRRKKQQEQAADTATAA
ncbi:SpaH/EbpB family LPXTG-anchored major pilin [Leucobacter chironomi]|uniref:SpaH/EbpB family LPXTG-anchored major pilin n=1 Tax=Leucobacter chironomi TaxID=491918 RepID=UPI0013755210|nr:SpaH/EbpB family LPXTG-anchored major pilin [Leucobacter chironomi]